MQGFFVDTFMDLSGWPALVGSRMMSRRMPVMMSPFVVMMALVVVMFMCRVTGRVGPGYRCRGGNGNRKNEQDGQNEYSFHGDIDFKK
jgi:hypothetical protein